ncbi:MAG TPA: hypothetical protein PLL30_15895 [Candidatus Krumholzibacteria bacterium]|nr:hypothetical protein [Candidatus Krumholzibacteria bacterium]HPD73253.1 hypothetical protein [Candidatus Krumholzibacteria bacterium]HRY40215.1 hypothetical protein [Candidatus Krumholzibacteria bacterium]
MNVPRDLSATCFVIMPFGRKRVQDREVDFDAIYDTVFAPAIGAVPRPEGGVLAPRRTDKDFFSGHISQEMFEYLEHSRLAVADISGLNANVFYEIGVRHRARAGGTVIVRQAGAPLPFDINQIKVFDYRCGDSAEVAASIQAITRILTETLAQNRLDSPVQQALRAQSPAIDPLLREAEAALGHGDRATAAARYGAAVAADPHNPFVRVRHGIVLKDLDRLPAAREQFERATFLQPGNAAAWRELGVIENLLYRALESPPAGIPDGEESLRRAVAADSDDFDALAALGGVLKRKDQLEDALAMYRRSAEVSDGHPYPLLNALKLQAAATGRLELDARWRRLLRRAERARADQTANRPPYDAPWSFFDLAEIRLYGGDQAGFLERLAQALDHCDHDWQAKTFRDGLQLLADRGVELPGIREGLAVIDESF